MKTQEKTQKHSKPYKNTQEHKKNSKSHKKTVNQMKKQQITRKNTKTR